MSARILITGSSGFSGRGLIAATLSKGFEVHALDIIPPKHLPKSQNFYYHQFDICDKELLNKSFDKKNINYEVHLAAYWNFKLGHEDKY